MNSSAMNFNLFALSAPKSREDLIVLAHEICDELDRVNRHFDSIFAESECLSDA